MNKAIYGIFAATLINVLITGCSDNYNQDFEPLETTRTLAVDVESDLYANGKLSLGAAPSTTTVKVESNTRWTAEVTDCNGGWCDIDVFNGASDGTFSISVRENMKEERTCYVKVYKVNAAGEKELSGSQEITISQTASDVRITPASLEPFPAQSAERKEFVIISNVAWTLSVNYEGDNATEFITVTPLSTAMQSDGKDFIGQGDAQFAISLQNNRTAADRKAFLVLNSAVATYTVEISQLKAEYTFDVSPAENQVVPATGGRINFGVLSLSGWKVTSSADWITFSPTTGAGSGTREETVATIAPNTYGYERSAEIYFTPESSNYQGLSLTVIQRGYDLTFSMSPEGTLGVFPDNGAGCLINIDSRFDWELVTPDWVIAETHSGTASLTERIVSLSVPRNDTNVTRTGMVTLYPQPTGFGNGVILSPDALGVQPLHVSVTQFGGQEPAISVPWLADGYTQTSVTVQFNYYSPFYAVESAGLQWKREDASDWNTVNVSIENGIEGIVSVDLTRLDGATKYVARGFVTDSEGRIKFGSITYPFTTAGQRPSGNDNPTPSM